MRLSLRSSFQESHLRGLGIMNTYDTIYGMEYISFTIHATINDNRLKRCAVLPHLYKNPILAYKGDGIVKDCIIP